MGKRGPQPKPTHLKVLAGNPGRRPLPENEPEPVRGFPVMPTWFDGLERAIWSEVTGELDAMGLLFTSDVATIVAYCEAYGEFQQNRMYLSENSSVITNAKGDSKPHPAVAIKQKAFDRLNRCVAKLGLSPADRVGLASDGKPTAKDGKQRFFNQSG